MDDAAIIAKLAALLNDANFDDPEELISFIEEHRDEIEEER